MQVTSGSPTTTATSSLAEDLRAVAEILLRLPSPAALVRAALASRLWREVASSPGFLRRYRSRHASSPLLGLYIPRARGGLPSFHLADSVRSDRALAKFARGGDFNLAGLESDAKWRLLDCHGGRLLLSRGESRAVYDPVTGRAPARFPQNSPLQGTFFSECLLQGHGDDAESFRVASVQHCGHDQMVRAAEYDSRTCQWHHHRWVKNIKRPEHDQAMHAGRLIFWRYDDASSLALDTTTMEFCILDLPFTFFQPSMYAIGDIEDGVSCLVGLVGSMNNLHLQMWLLKEDGAAKMWISKNKVPVSQVLGRDVQLRQVHAVVNGLAFLCWDHCHQFAINLKKMCISDEFECSALGYPLQMPWPPAALVKTESETVNYVVDLLTENILAMAATEMNMMVDIQCNKMVHGSNSNQIKMVHGGDTSESAIQTKSRCGSEMVSSDSGGEMIHCNQPVIPDSEAVQSIETTGTGGMVTPTTTRCNSYVDHGDEMIHRNKMVIRGSEMVQGLAHGNYTVVALPITSRKRSEMVAGSKMHQGGEMISRNKNVIHAREMVGGIEMTHGNGTAEVAPPTTARTRRKNSIIWDHFTTESDSDGCTRACCNYCKRTFVYSSGSKTVGTSHLKRHITMGSCPMINGLVLPPVAGGTGNSGSGAAEKASKRRCKYAGQSNAALTESPTMKLEDEYSISKCKKVLNDMGDVSDEIKHLAFHVLKDATNREIFMSYEPRLRGLWLKKEVNKLRT